MSRIFISHAQTDREFVETNLLGLLNSLGFDTWFAESAIGSAEQWEESILAGLKESQWFLAVLSQNAAGSQWVRDEISWAMRHRQYHTIPLLLTDCDLETLHVRLPRLQCVDFRTDTRRACNDLIRVLVQARYRTPTLAHVILDLMRCPSKEILTVVQAETTQELTQATIVAANSRAEDFYGRKAGGSIVGTSVEDIFRLLSGWMDASDFTEFREDQQLKYDAIRRGEEVYARVPIRINSNHPNRRYHGREFLPVTIAYSIPEAIQGTRVEYLAVIYIDLGELQRK